MTFQSYKRKLWQFLLLTKTVITWSKILPYLIHLSKQILNQYTKKIPGKNRKITVLSVSYKTYLKVMSIASTHRWKSTLILFFLYINLDLEWDVMQYKIDLVTSLGLIVSGQENIVINEQKNILESYCTGSECMSYMITKYYF